MRTPHRLRRTTTVGVFLLALLVTACGPAAEDTALGPATDETPAVDTLDGEVTAVVHKSPTCECCVAHEEYLDGAGFPTVGEIHEDDLTTWKEARGIPRELWSCHTTEVGGYLVEGHVPADTIVRLLEEQPDVDGIALPGMPAGSPGMGGVQDEPWVVEAFADGATVGVFETR